MQQVYFVNRHFAFKNLQIGSKSHPARMVLKNKDKYRTSNTMVRSLNNVPSQANIEYQDKVYFPTGLVRGVAVLVIGYRDRPVGYSIWLPQMQKVRRFSEPAHDDRWGGSPFTYGDVYFRKPKHESHELLTTEKFGDCLDMMAVSPGANLGRAKLPGKNCDVRDQEVFRLKSTTHFKDWWYDYRLVSVDKDSFADYRSDYYKDGKLVKRIDKDWQAVDESAPRAVMWQYWYVHDYLNGQDAVVYVNLEHVQWNQKVKSSDWTERALRKIKR